jgi:hypothetical protein
MTNKFNMLYEETMNEFNVNDIKHFTLDLVGLIPGLGDPADIANGISYANEAQKESDNTKKAEKYLYSALSFISAIPEPISDAVAKGIKVLGGKKLIGPVIQKIGPEKIMKIWEKFMKEYLPKILSHAKEKNIKDFDQNIADDMNTSVTTSLQNLSK